MADEYFQVTKSLFLKKDAVISIYISSNSSKAISKGFKAIVSLSNGRELEFDRNEGSIDDFIKNLFNGISLSENTSIRNKP
jgi:hypothetical protein